MPFHTDLFPNDVIRLETACDVILIKLEKRTGQRVRIAIDADQSVKINKIEAPENVKRKFKPR